MRFGRTIATAYAAGIVLASADAAFAAPSSRHDANRIADFSFGVFCPPGKSYKTSADDTIRGETTRYDDSPVLVLKTQTIPAIDGITFGVEGRENQESPADVTIVVDHPPMGSDGVTRESWTTQMEEQRITFHGYFLGMADGNPNGLWTITGIRDGQELFHTEFEVIPGKSADPDEDDPCLTMLIS